MNGVLCTGSKDNQNCTKLELICNRLNPQFRETKLMEQGTPITIEKINMSTFEVYQSSLDARTSYKRPIPFIAYHRINSDQSVDANTVNFKKRNKVVFYIHGYSTEDLEAATRIKTALFYGARDLNYFVIVDWRKWSLSSDDSDYKWLPNYKIVALENVPVVTDKVHKFLLSKLSNENYIYIVGFSLGAHVARTAARRAANDKLNVDRITGLDAAGPIFEYSNGLFQVDATNTLRKSDATFVDLIHSSELFGLRKPVGHLDIYLKENSCFFALCKHRRARDLFISSLARCSLITCPRNGKKCNGGTISEFGYLADKYPGRGEHELTIKTDWFNWRDKECNQFFNLYLPAKDRVCHRPPNSNKNCRNIPYLTECNVGCSGLRSDVVTATVVCAHKANVGLKKREVKQLGSRSATNFTVETNQSGTRSATNFTIEGRSNKVKWHQQREC